MPDTNSNDDRPEAGDRTADGTGVDRPAAANRYLRRATERPEDVHDERERLVELLSGSGSTAGNELERRAAASAALAKLARDRPTFLEASLPVLVEELRREQDRELPDGGAEYSAVSRAIRANLVRAVATVIGETSGTTLRRGAFVDFVRAVTTDLDEETLRMAARALFTSADDRSVGLATAPERLRALLAHPDPVVEALAAGTVGRVAADHPDAVADTAAVDELRALLEHHESAVQHNAVEALAALVGPRPDSVAPAADALRTLLGHEDAAVQHNAAGVLGRLAAEHPDAVLPAIADLQRLRDHDDEAVRRRATAAVARLARERSDDADDR
jgi:hypothetical protein